MSRGRRGGSWSGNYGLTRAERAMGGNTAQDRKDIEAAAAVTRGRRYYRDMDSSDPIAPAAPAKPDTKDTEK